MIKKRFGIAILLLTAFSSVGSALQAESALEKARMAAKKAEALSSGSSASKSNVSTVATDEDFSKWEDLVNKCLAMQEGQSDVEAKEQKLYVNLPPQSLMGRIKVKDYPKFKVYYSGGRCQIVWPNGDYITKVNGGLIKDYFVNKTYADGSGFHNVQITDGYHSKSACICLALNEYPLSYYTFLQPPLAPDGVELSWIANPDGTWAKGNYVSNNGYLYIEGIDTQWELVEALWTANTLPSMKIVQSHMYSKIGIFKGTEVKKTLDPKYVSEYKLDSADSFELENGVKKSKMKPLVGTYTMSDVTTTGDQKKSYSITLKEDGTCTAVIKWHWKNVYFNRMGFKTTEVYDATFNFADESLWGYLIDEDKFLINLNLAQSKPTGTVVTNGAQKRVMNWGELVAAGQELVKAINNNFYVPNANNTKLKATGKTPYELTRSGSTAAKKPAASGAKKPAARKK